MLLLLCLKQLQEALMYLHNRNVLHRNLKPENILFDKDGDLKVIGFGLAKDISVDISTNDRGEVAGSPYYM